MDKELKIWVDREKIRHAVVTLARGEDRRDGDLISTVYWPDAVTDFGMFQGDFAAYLAWVVPGADVIKNTQHVLGQSYIDLKGDVALVETHVVSYHRVEFAPGDEHDVCMGGRYLDRFEERAGEWRIASRTMLYDWVQDWGQSIDWAHGVMGMPFTHEWFSGRAHGDRSEVFFGKRPA